MDPRLLRVFQDQVWTQTRYFLIAWTQHEEALRRNDLLLVWYCVENMLNATANIAKALWGSGGKRNDPRQRLRESLGIADASPLRITTMRNHFQHFDERIDRWWKQSTQHNYVDMNIGFSVQGVDARDVFRTYFPQTGEVRFGGETFDLRAIHTELLNLYAPLQAEVERPYWNV